jgi:hypothetical protein
VLCCISFPFEFEVSDLPTSVIHRGELGHRYLCGGAGLQWLFSALAVACPDLSGFRCHVYVYNGARNEQLFQPWRNAATVRLLLRCLGCNRMYVPGRFMSRVPSVHFVDVSHRGCVQQRRTPVVLLRWIWECQCVAQMCQPRRSLVFESSALAIRIPFKSVCRHLLFYCDPGNFQACVVGVLVPVQCGWWKLWRRVCHYKWMDGRSVQLWD